MPASRVVLTTLCIATALAAHVLSEDIPVTWTSVVKLESSEDRSRLHSHDVKYGSGSGQQSVTGVTTNDDVNSHWQILGPIDDVRERGVPIDCGSTLRLLHQMTRCFLHSHEFSAPLSRGNQEVSCFGKEGESSDTGDHFKVICSGDTWMEQDQVRLKHIETGKYLAASGQQYGRPIAGQREIIGTASPGYGSLWRAAEGIYIKPEL